MDRKIKIILGTLGLIAVFSVYFVFSSFKNNPLAKLAGAYQESKKLDPVSTDSDKDGLSDREESIWGTNTQNPDTDGDGFKDGEEAISGHNPTLAGPNDSLYPDKKANVSERLSALLLSGLSEGSLKKDNPKY